MKKDKFMAQQVKDMSFEELLKAMSYKLEESKEESPKTTEPKLGDRVKIIREYRQGKGGYDNTMGELLSTTHTSSYPYAVKSEKDGELVGCIEIELAEEELKAGDRVKIIQYHREGIKSSNDGREGTIIDREIDIENLTLKGEYRIRLDDGSVCIAYKVEKIEKKSLSLSDKIGIKIENRVEWTSKDITGIIRVKDVKHTFSLIKGDIDDIKSVEKGKTENTILIKDRLKEIIDRRAGKRLI